jgi:hypothetical protein
MSAGLGAGSRVAPLNAASPLAFSQDCHVFWLTSHYGRKQQSPSRLRLLPTCHVYTLRLYGLPGARPNVGATLTFEDARFEYGERRFVTLGLLSGIPVSIVHTEDPHEIRIISFRKATSREEALLSQGFA